MSVYIAFGFGLKANWSYDADFATTAPIFDQGPDATCFLGATICGYFVYDTWTLSLAIWICLQLSWSVCLLFVQSYQIAAATTTNESANAHRYSYMNGQDSGVMAQLAAGPGGLVAGSDGPGSSNGGGHHHHGHAHRNLSNSNFCPCLQMVAGARAIHKARSRRQQGGGPSNVFDHGCWANCVEFWSDPNDSAINWYELYDVRQLQKPTHAV